MVRVGFENKEKRSRRRFQNICNNKVPNSLYSLILLYTYAICGSYGFANPSLFEKLGL
jgi:hypothetical protein